jgi:hypothetical protein
MKIYPKTALCVPEGDLEETLIAEIPKSQVAEWLKDKNPEEFLLVSPEKKHVPVVVLVPSRHFIAAYTKPVDTSAPIAIFNNHPGTRKLQRVIDWYSEKHYQVVVH